MTPDASKMGSITQGTPIHVPHVQDKRVYDFYNKRPPAPPQQQANYAPQYRQPAYTVEQQLSSRQIIMNDYITSQQMLSRRGEKQPQYYPPSSPHRTPPPPQPQQQRQGVIQRHVRPPHYPPGHEAFSSLVDVAVQQPSLPVPSAPHEGLGKTMADNIMEQPHRFHLIQQQQRQQRIEAERRAYQQQQQQQQQQRQVSGVGCLVFDCFVLGTFTVETAEQVPRSDSSTLTAASLIDAIITHQINQTAEGARETPPSQREPPRPSDLLFQRVHQDNNGERSPPVINVDLEAEKVVGKSLTVKELTDSVISHDFGARQGFYHHEQWKHRMQKEGKRAGTPQQDERQIIRIAQPQKYHVDRPGEFGGGVKGACVAFEVMPSCAFLRGSVSNTGLHVEPVSPPENNHWAEQNFRRYQQPQSHISAFDYVKNRIVEVMRTEDDKKDEPQQHQDKERSADSPGEMVIDEEKHDGDKEQQFQFAYAPKEGVATSGEVGARNAEPKPLLSEQYEPLSDED